MNTFNLEIKIYNQNDKTKVIFISEKRNIKEYFRKAW